MGHVPSARGGVERKGGVTRNSSNVLLPVNIQAAGEATWNASD